MNLLGLTLQELREITQARKQPDFRARQLYHAIYRLRKTHFAEMTDLSKPFRALLSKDFAIHLPEVLRVERSDDSTEKYLLGLHDGLKIEMVYIPEPGRHTLCISSQVGCNAGCCYCVTASMGLARNLSSGEIIGQVLLCEHLKPSLIGHFNIVLMGMGEPLLNCEATLKALRLLMDPDGISISPRRITLSTCGIIPGLERLAQERVLPQIAISLGAPYDDLRSQLIPINLKWNLAALLETCKRLPLRGRISLEYTLIRGVNDSAKHARMLVKLVHGLRVKVNLIPLNSHPLLPYQRPDQETILRFQETLADHGIATFIRKPRGNDIAAACGQLAIQEGPSRATDATVIPAPSRAKNPAVI